jgi:hypothetical protein
MMSHREENDTGTDIKNGWVKIIHHKLSLTHKFGC